MEVEEMVDLPEIGRRIKAIRESRGLTQKELADKIGLSRSYVASSETGVIRPNIEALSKMAEVFGIPVSALVAVEKTPEEEELRPNNTVMAAKKVEEILYSIEKLWNLPGYDAGAYDNLVGELTVDLADILDLPVEKLYEEGFPLFPLRPKPPEPPKKRGWFDPPEIEEEKKPVNVRRVLVPVVPTVEPKKDGEK